MIGDSGVLGFFALLAVSLCGLAAAPIWSMAVAAIALTSISYARYQVLFRRAADLGLRQATDQTLIASLLNALLASGGAYGCGAALRFLSLA